MEQKIDKIIELLRKTGDRITNLKDRTERVKTGE